MRKNEIKREQSINALVDTALKLFSQNGYEATSIRMIAKEAEVSLGLMYNYFKSKEELLLEIFRRGSEDIHMSFEEGLANSEANVSEVAQHINQTVRLLKEKKLFWKLLHGIRMQTTVVHALKTQIEEQAKLIETKIKQNLSTAGFPHPELEAKLLFASIDGMASHYLLLDNYPIDDVASLLIRKYDKQ
ncbi:TetR/AcrR family transcriptional regulator [Pontibacter locisalis]|uniref:TetR/AcrR family transcriptional regulator n=1 Tax=Pontibacter locisalis TaxID=1719035 RepID=A0ABW5IR30_9BACT